MRYLLLLLLLLLCNAFTGNAQIIALHNNFTQRVHDTTISLQYFKNADSALLNKLDSFDLFLAQTKYKIDSNYFYTISFEERQCKKRAIIRYNSQYDDYVLVANLGRHKSPNKYRTVFAFFFYKNRLVLCDVLRRDLHLTEESLKLLTNLIYENVNQSEKKLILGYPQDEYNVLTKPVKGYFLE